MTEFERAIIIANSNQSVRNDLTSIISSKDLLIAADGGGKHCLDAGWTPQIIIGDLDSISKTELNKLIDLGTEVLTYPVRKNETDLELAMTLAIKKGVKEVIVLSALGGRWDHTLGNIMLLAHNKFESTRIRIIENNQEINLIRAEHTYSINGTPGDTISLIPISNTAVGVTASGLEYQLDNSTLAFGATLSLSNKLIARQATIKMKKGLLICIVIRSTK
ncbi:MAG: thiamine diphosphokinase [Anaerolineaceae bacterium]|nr:thiamine diphosphokinase [Anaerolineaceae bacterium]|tara:strand:+ start:63159 stop:63818 length:660 start_codon:yes stop_codon:yes gene_type:complete